MSEDWKEYLNSARRKAEIAAYHLDGLRKALLENSFSQAGMPDIAIQAHFEAIITSSIAAGDQVAQGVNSALSKHFSPANLFQDAFSLLSEAISECAEWMSKSIGRDLRRIRTRIVHHKYEKTSEGPLWIVESANTAYEGPRDLENYAIESIKHCGELIDILPKIEKYLESQRLQAN